MQTIKAILVDDESDSREVLQSLLERFFPEIELLGMAANVDEAYEVIKNTKPELVFLDIQMPKASGFDLLKRFEEIPFEVIFVTSFDKYAITAIKFSALYYILKPIETLELKAAIEKAKKQIALKTKSDIQIVNLLHNLESGENARKLAVHVGENVKLLTVANIVYIEANGRYSTITYDTNENFISARVLKDFEDFFGENSEFVRIHKSCIINTGYIKEYSKGEPCFMKMTNGKTFEVARRKKQEVLEKLKK